jgi:hypothetical protein
MCKVLIRENEGKVPFLKPWSRWKENKVINLTLIEADYDSVHWSSLVRADTHRGLM